MRALLLLPLLLAACTTTPAPSCIDDGDCDGVAVCTEDNVCLEVECTHASQCNLGYTCDDSNACVQGCTEEDDCLAGESCNATADGIGQCIPYGCRTTTLDCEYGERCDQNTHTCVQDPEPHCQPGCTVDFFSDSCELQSFDAVCACFGSVSGTQCNGNSYCLVACNPSEAEPCPRGYQCAQAFSNNPTPYCIADCDFISQF